MRFTLNLILLFAVSPTPSLAVGLPPSDAGRNVRLPQRRVNLTTLAAAGRAGCAALRAKRAKALERAPRDVEKRARDDDGDRD